MALRSPPKLRNKLTRKASVFAAESARRATWGVENRG
jgi:hypothetical protein